MFYRIQCKIHRRKTVGNIGYGEGRGKVKNINVCVGGGGGGGLGERAGRGGKGMGCKLFTGCKLTEELPFSPSRNGAGARF